MIIIRTKPAVINWADVMEHEVAPGVFQKIISGQNHMMVMWRMLKGTVASVHAHPHEQMTLILSGRIEGTLGDEPITLGPGDLVFVPPNVPHGGLMREDVEMLETFAPPREDLLGEPTFGH